MSHQLINHNADLKELRDKGFNIEISGAMLLVKSLPYVNSNKKILRDGVLVCVLDLLGENTRQPESHITYFVGEAPCHKDGRQISEIINNSNKQIVNGVEINHTLSAKPPGGRYKDYFEKISTYVNLICSPAQAINRFVTAKTFEPIKINGDDDCVFNYLDMNSSRGQIDLVSAKLKGQKVGIIGLGGTGSYVLDFVSKTWVSKIYIFDGDDFSSHNAFRCPGAFSLSDLNKKEKKVNHFYRIYSKLHKGIVPQAIYLDDVNIERFFPLDFVFICIDNGKTKQLIVNKLLESNTPFVDVGIGIENVENSLRGTIRTTAVTADKKDHVATTISYDNARNDYSTNIQIAEINALNAALAVLKWKKLYGFYHDQKNEYNSFYNIDLNQLINNETKK